MEKKKVLALFLGSLLAVSSTMFLGGVIIDPELTAAEDITRKIFNANILNENEKKKKIGYFAAEYLPGLDKENDYILVNNTLGGYAIFEREGMELIEYSDKTASPYEQERDEIYYAGPANYYRKDKETIKHIYTGEKVDKEQLLDKAKNVKERIKEKRKDRREKEKQKNTEENKKDAELIPKEASLYANSFIKGDLLSSAEDFNVAPANPGPTGEEIINADDYEIKERTYIENEEYFLRIPTYPNNLGETCSTVATHILLSYHNWISDGRLIPANNETERFLQYDENQMTEAELNTLRSNPHNPEIMMASYEYNTAETVSFYEKLLAYIDSGLDGAMVTDIYTGITNYLTDYVPAIKHEISMDYSFIELEPSMTASRTKIINEIDADRPVIATMYCYKPNGSNYEIARHCIIVYGYQTILYQNQELNGVIANLGWNSKDTNHGWVNFDWIYGFLSFRTNHIHTDEVLAVETIDNVSVGSEFSLSPSHVMICTTCERTAYNDAHYYSVYSQVSPEEWDESFFHQRFCVCLDRIVEPHHLHYIIEDAFTHQASCAECGYSKYDRHYYKYENKCFYCGYEDF